MSGAVGEAWVARPYQRGNVNKPTKTSRPAKICGRSRMDGLLAHERLAAEVGGPLLLAGHHQGVAQQFMDSCDLDSSNPVVHQRGQSGLIDGADASQQVD